MDLLRTIRENALDPAFTEAASSPRRRAHPWVRTATVLVIGLVLGLAFGATTRAAPEGAAERTLLIERIRQVEDEQDALRARADDLGRENAELERALAGVDPATEERAAQLASQTGQSAVTGPGVRVTVDDGPDTTQGISRVLDGDLRVLVNALWGAGAEAIALNGHRLSSRTAIREAGDAVTVNYRSLTRPYVVEAIGDPGSLADGLAASSGGAWWRGLQQQYQMQFVVERADRLTMDADPGLGIELAQPVR